MTTFVGEEGGEAGGRGLKFKLFVRLRWRVIVVRDGGRERVKGEIISFFEENAPFSELSFAFFGSNRELILLHFLQ